MVKINKFPPPLLQHSVLFCKDNHCHQLPVSLSEISDVHSEIDIMFPTIYYMYLVLFPFK